MPRSRYRKFCYLMSKSLADRGRVSWACNIKMMLYQLGFRNVWTEQEVGDEDSFILMFTHFHPQLFAWLVSDYCILE